MNIYLILQKVKLSYITSFKKSNKKSFLYAKLYHFTTLKGWNVNNEF